jgi:hypothetical protein
VAGRIYLSGPEDQITAARDTIVAVLGRVEGRGMRAGEGG